MTHWGHPLNASSPLPEPSDRDLNCLLASLVQLLGDPHTRTLPGFQSLVQREWVAAGHPFPHRLGLLRHDSPREEVRTYPVPPLPRPCPRWVTGTRVVPPQAPVFLLFLDCTWQLVRQFPAAFGFTEAYLLALHDSSFAPYFSTFLFSCQRQRGRGSPVSLEGGAHAPGSLASKRGLGTDLGTEVNPLPSRLAASSCAMPQFPHPYPQLGIDTPPKAPVSSRLLPAAPAS